MAELSPAQVAEIRARAEKATPGPWAFWGGSVMKGNTPLLVLDNAPHFESDCTYCANAEFAVHARTDVPDLCNSYDAQARRIAEALTHARNLRHGIFADADAVNQVMDQLIEVLDGK